MPPKLTKQFIPTTPTPLDQRSLIALADSLAASTSEFAHDANNLVLQVIAAHEMVGDKLGTPIATDDELEVLMGYARNLSTIARDLARLVEESDPTD